MCEKFDSSINCLGKWFNNSSNCIRFFSHVKECAYSTCSMFIIPIESLLCQSEIIAMPFVQAFFWENFKLTRIIKLSHKKYDILFNFLIHPFEFCFIHQCVLKCNCLHQVFMISLSSCQADSTAASIQYSMKNDI